VTEVDDVTEVTEETVSRPGPLDGCRVVDLAGPIGAMCSKLLADLGCDVIKVEPPTGDPMRGRPPFVAGPSGQEESAVFASYHANKRGVTADASRMEARPLLQAMARDSDVVVISHTVRTPVTGFDRTTRRLDWAPPDCIVVSITPFGLDGPLADMRVTPFLSFAIGGGMHWVGEKGGPPLAAPGQLAWDEAGLHAAFGAVSALFGRRPTGGQFLDLSVHEVQASKDFMLERYDVSKPGEWGGRFAGVGIPPSGTWQCADGPLGIAAHQEHHWQTFLAMMDHPEELSEESLNDPLVRRLIFDGLEQVIANLVAGRSRLDLFDRGQAAGLPCAPVNSPADFVEDPQPVARGLFCSTSAEGRPAITIPWRWCRATPELIHLRRGAPGLGEHNAEVYLGELGYAESQLESWRVDGLI
jgi:crotonobetainyl-CoA:carnitine CoA-transferase CaiB-like acyl-CoA transferase